MSSTKNQWKKGVSGNPAGRKPGQRHKTTVMLEKLMEADSEAIVKAVMTAALSGDMSAARMILDRVVPPAKDRTLYLDLPETATTEGVEMAQETVVRAVSNGQLRPSEGTILSNLLDSRRRAIETGELAQRIEAIEARVER